MPFKQWLSVCLWPRFYVYNLMFAEYPDAIYRPSEQSVALNTQLQHPSVSNQPPTYQSPAAGCQIPESNKDLPPSYDSLNFI